ncbi:MAG: hypothetical protein ACI9FY_001524, partial [Patiriisocius sp.]
MNSSIEYYQFFQSFLEDTLQLLAGHFTWFV